MNNIFTIEKIKDVIVVNLLFAELSMEDAEDLKKALYEHVTDSSNKFIIDLDKCVFFPSMALGVLIALKKNIHAVKGQIVLCRPTKKVRQYLR